jgi:hypothetical protein
MPTRRALADQDRANALHLLKKAAIADAELDLAAQFDEARQEFALIRAKAEQLAQLADDMERMCASRVLTLIGKAEPPGPHT